MDKHAEDCMICGKPLVYFESAKKAKCYICGETFDTNVVCEDEHYVCDACHAEDALLAITLYAQKTQSTNPMEIAIEMMKDPAVNMHGPEHHYLVPAALLTAYKNAGVMIAFDKALQDILQRSKNVPGGICGMWGSCGAAVGTGIFFSVITGATPLSGKEWSLANKMTSDSLAVISENGGPRCCKRNSFLAINQSVISLKEQFDFALELPEKITCEFSGRNKQCRGEDCLYYVSLS